MNEREQDAELLRRAAAGESGAFAELVQRHQDWVFQLAYRFSRDRQDAEELAQEIFFRAWRRAAGFRGEAAFSTWLYRLAVNVCLNYRQKAKSCPAPLSLESEPQAAQPEAGEALVAGEREARLRQAMDALPRRQRLALVLAGFEGRSYEEIAAAMAVSVASVESLLFRARRNLAAALEPLRDKGEL